MYNNFMQWKKVEPSKGKVLISDDEIYKFWLKWVRENQEINTIP